MANQQTPARLLIAGLGNIFLGDDGVGVEIVRRLAGHPMPAGVTLADIGIRGVHLAFELLERPHDTTILVDAMTRGGAPGTVYLVEPDVVDAAPAEAADAHALTPDGVLAYLSAIGGRPGRLLIVGVEPASCEEGMALSAPVERAVDEAVRLVLDVVQRESTEPRGARIGE